MIWAARGSNRLGPRALALLQVLEASVSSITSLETRIKVMLGKLEDLDFSLLEENFNIRYLEFGHRDALSLENFPSLTRHDPFDRALLAHAHNRGALFLTSDRQLLELELSWVLDSTI